MDSGLPRSKMTLVAGGCLPGSTTVHDRPSSTSRCPSRDTSASLPSVFQTSSSDPEPSDRAELTDIRGAIGFSSFCVLLYYAVANASAFTLRARRFIPVLGLAGCVLLAVALPLSSVLSGAAVVAAGIVAYAIGASRR